MAQPEYSLSLPSCKIEKLLVEYGITHLEQNIMLLGRMCSELCCPKNHGLRTPNEGIDQKYLENWADVADKICFGRT